MSTPPGNTVNTLVLLPPPPPTLPPWAKVVWYAADFVATGVTYVAFDYAQSMPTTKTLETDPDPAQWRHIQVTAEDTTSADTADDQVFTFDLVNYTNGAIDSSWTIDDYNAVDLHLQGFLNSIKPNLQPRLTFTRWAAYVRQWNPKTIAKPWPDSGQPEHVGVLNIACTGVGALPPQVCSTVTELTPSRKHWGRFYSPTLAGNTIAASGRLATAFQDGLVAAASSMYESLVSTELIPVVPSLMADKVPARTLQQVTGVRVDDVVDTQRSRRFKNNTRVISDPI